MSEPKITLSFGGILYGAQEQPVRAVCYTSAVAGELYPTLTVAEREREPTPEEQEFWNNLPWHIKKWFAVDVDD